MGIKVEVDVPLHPITPTPTRGQAKRPAWQTAIHAIALACWIGLLGRLVYARAVASAAWVFVGGVGYIGVLKWAKAAVRPPQAKGE